MPTQQNHENQGKDTKDHKPRVYKEGNKTSIQGGFEVTDGTLDPNSDAIYQPAFIHPTATPTRLKIKASLYFLARLKQTIRNEAAALFYTEALIQALRSATFVLQKLAEKTPEFESWYKEKRELMKKDPILRTMVDLRNVSEKEGLSFVQFQVGTIVKYYKDGHVECDCAEPMLRFEGKELPNAISSFETAITTISQIIEEAHKCGFLSVPEGKQIRIEMNFLREKDDGAWEPFDP